VTADGLVEQLGLLGVFLAGAIPWLEAVTVIPIGVLVGLDPLLTFIFAIGGNILTVILFAYLSKQILHWLSERRERKTGLESRDSRAERARHIFDRYGIIGMGLLGPLVVRTQFAAAVAVSFGVSPLKSSVVVSIGATLLGLMAGGVTLGIISL
jgi:uncharacterized membrane protein